MHVDTNNKGPRCETCIFARGHRKFTDGTVMIWCHRYPPEWNADVELWGMPYIPGTAWCGEYRPKDTRTEAEKDYDFERYSKAP